MLLPKDTVHSSPVEKHDVHVQIRKSSAPQLGREDCALWQEQEGWVLQQVTTTPPAAAAAATGTTTIAMKFIGTKKGDNAQQLFGFMEQVSDSKNLS